MITQEDITTKVVDMMVDDSNFTAKYVIIDKASYDSIYNPKLFTDKRKNNLSFSNVSGSLTSTLSLKVLSVDIDSDFLKVTE